MVETIRGGDLLCAASLLRVTVRFPYCQRLSLAVMFPAGQMSCHGGRATYQGADGRHIPFIMCCFVAGVDRTVVRETG